MQSTKKLGATDEALRPVAASPYESMDDLGDGSNMLIAPAKKKVKAPAAPVEKKMGKEMMRKLKKIEMEKQKKALRTEALALLAQHSLSSSNQQLLAKSGKIGQKQFKRERLAQAYLVRASTRFYRGALQLLRFIFHVTFYRQCILQLCAATLIVCMRFCTPNRMHADSVLRL